MFVEVVWLAPFCVEMFVPAYVSRRPDSALFQHLTSPTALNNNNPPLPPKNNLSPSCDPNRIQYLF